MLKVAGIAVALYVCYSDLSNRKNGGKKENGAHELWQDYYIY